MEPTLLNYIMTELEKGTKETQIRNALLTAGWKKEQIEAGFTTIYKASETEMPLGIGFTIKRIRASRTILKESLMILRNQPVWLLLGILILLPDGALTLLSIASPGADSVPVAVLKAILFGVKIGVIIWYMIAIIMMARHRRIHLPFVGLIIQPFSLIAGVIWIIILSQALITGAFFFFIIPGVLYSIWFSLAVIVAVTEQEHGMNALLISRQYTKMYKRTVLSRMAFLQLFLLCIFLIFGFLRILLTPFLQTTTATEIITFISTSLPLPFSIALSLTYLVLLYEDLVAMHGPATFQEKKRNVFVYGIIAFFGYLLAFAAGMYLFKFVLQGIFENAI